MEKIQSFLEQGRDWLDGFGRPGWLVAMVAGFLIFPPIGLGLLAYMLWSDRMASWKECGGRWRRRARRRGDDTGNAAFDAYRAEMLQRLEDERQAFAAFMERLRRAKDQAEFDQFMNERARGPAPASAAPETPAAPQPRSDGFGPGPQPA